MEEKIMIDGIEIAQKYYDFFELCVLDDQWERLESLFDEHAVYEIKGKTPIKTVIKGRDKILKGFKKSLDNFDRKLDSRHVVYGTQPIQKGCVVSYRLDAHYTMKNYPDLSFPAWSKLTIQNGKIVKEVDIYKIYDLKTIKALQWYGKYAKKLNLDASYN